jgi:hypothetical protein
MAWIDEPQLLDLNSHNTISYRLPSALQHGYRPIFKFRNETQWLSSKSNSWYSEAVPGMGWVSELTEASEMAMEWNVFESAPLPTSANSTGNTGKQTF